MTTATARQAMFKKPNQTSPARQLLWELMRQGCDFSTTELAQTAGVSAQVVRRYVKLLITADYVEQGDRRRFWLKQDTGCLAPDVTPSREFLYDPNKDRFIPVFPKRSGIPEAPASNSAEGKLWLGLRILRVSTAGELCTATELPYRQVKGWLRSLNQFGYVREAGESGGEMAYVLVQNNGPRAPSIDRHRGLLRDNNTQKIITL